MSSQGAALKSIPALWFIMAHNIGTGLGIQMKWKELAKTFIMISNLKKPLVSLVYKKAAL